MSELEKIMPIKEFEEFLIEGLCETEKVMKGIYGEPSMNMTLSPYYSLIAEHYGTISLSISIGMIAALSMVERALQTRELEKLRG